MSIMYITKEEKQRLDQGFGYSAFENAVFYKNLNDLYKSVEGEIVY